MEYNCYQCRNIFQTSPSKVKNSKRVFCSRECMGEAFKRTPEELEATRQRHLAKKREYRNKHPEKAKEYREKNSDKIRQLERNWYLKNKDKVIEKAKRQYKKRKKLYHSDEDFNKHLNIKAVEFARNKMANDEKYKQKRIEDSTQYAEKNQDITLDNIAVKGLRWSLGEIEYLRSNYKEKTRLDMALELGRTYKAIKSALQRFNIGRKNRVLTTNQKEAL